MIAGFREQQDGTVLFCPGLFHQQIQNGEIEVFQTLHPSIAVVLNKDGSYSYIFWDEAGLACPAGDTFAKAEQALAAYCAQL